VVADKLHCCTIYFNFLIATFIHYFYFKPVCNRNRGHADGKLSCLCWISKSYSANNCAFHTWSVSSSPLVAFDKNTSFSKFPFGQFTQIRNHVRGVCLCQLLNPFSAILWPSWITLTYPASKITLSWLHCALSLYYAQIIHSHFGALHCSLINWVKGRVFTSATEVQLQQQGNTDCSLHYFSALLRYRCFG